MVIQNETKDVKERDISSRRRHDLHCVSIPLEEWLAARDMALNDGRSVSSLLKMLIRERCKKGGKKDKTIADKKNNPAINNQQD